MLPERRDRAISHGIGGDEVVFQVAFEWRSHHAVSCVSTAPLNGIASPMTTSNA